MPSWPSLARHVCAGSAVVVCLLTTGASSAQEPVRANGAAYRRLVQRYLRGDFSAATEVPVVDWKTVEEERDLIVHELADEFHGETAQGDRLAAARAQDRLARTALAMALLHTDACLQPAVAADSDQMEMQLALAGRAIYSLDGLAAQFGDSVPTVPVLTADEVRGAVKQWHELAALILAARDRPTLWEFLDRAEKRYPADPTFKLLWGNLREQLAARAVVDPSLVEKVYGSKYIDSWRRLLDGARQDYRDALGADPHMAEARVRLGRVEMLIGDRMRARTNLEQALADASTPRLRYLAALFLGAVAAADGRLDEARERFQHAWSIVPGAESAAMALSRLADEQGSDADARMWLERTLNVPHRPQDDPWETYNFIAPPGDVPDRLERLRTLLRQ